MAVTRSPRRAAPGRSRTTGTRRTPSRRRSRTSRRTCRRARSAAAPIAARSCGGSTPCPARADGFSAAAALRCSSPLPTSPSPRSRASRRASLPASAARRSATARTSSAVCAPPDTARSGARRPGACAAR